MSKNITPGTLWISLATMIPLIVVFVQGAGESGLIEASIAAAIVVALSAIARIIEIFTEEPEQEEEIPILGNVRPAGAPAQQSILTRESVLTVGSRVLLGG